MSSITIENALKKYNRRYYVLQLKNEVVHLFSRNVEHFITLVMNAVERGESEEHIKNYTNEFLKKSLYSNRDYEINTSKRIDSTIKCKGSVQAIIETKNPKNKNEMVSQNNINVKSLHEVIFYYLSLTRNVLGTKVERNIDTEIRRLIITDGIHWALIDANDIEKIVDGYLEKHYFKYQNNQLIYSNSTDKFYKDIEQYLDKIDINSVLSYVFFDITEYTSPQKIEYLYKILHRQFLLKENTNDIKSYHVLNNKFYQELLYIMGLKEKSGKSSKTIEIDHSLENTIANQVYDILKNDKEYSENQCVEDTFELVIIWMNRLLFIKLFEGQLIKFNGDYPQHHILDSSKITSFQNLQDLFFEVLGKKDRDQTDFLRQFNSIPYLNSALFERQEIEKRDVNINVLQNGKVQLKKNSVVGTTDSTKVPILDYIISFLNSYSFSSEEGENNTIVKGQDIIDASVLGLIFEKLNGYRDGSYYTPSVITEYMCQQVVEQTILDKINSTMNWKCSDLFEVRANMGQSLSEARQINNIINSITICDPAVGSGHFLVSALNRIIAVKKQLGVLFKYGRNELLTEYDIDVVDDVLRIYDGQGHPFVYDKKNSLSQTVQETIFNEKRIIIENCLFGVDINSKAVSICQLRLWIELLKNAYYKNGVMETLPNIDINIKTGNSLVNQLDFAVKKKLTFTKMNVGNYASKLLKQYKQLVNDYKATSDKDKKNEIKKNIEDIKTELRGMSTDIVMVPSKNAGLKLTVGDDPQIYNNAFEWAIEFPEILDDNFTFLGFDCIIGNPPYGLLNKKQNQNTSISISGNLLEHYKNDLSYAPAKGGVLNIYRLFICRSLALLKPRGHMCLIFPLAFMCDITAKNIRQYIMENTCIDYIEAFPERDNENKRVFKEVKMSVCILGVTKKKVRGNYKIPVRINRSNYVDDNNEILYISYDDIKKIDESSLSIPLIQQQELPILLKMTDDCVRMKEISKCYTGEIDLSLCKKYITTSPDDDLMLRGAQVQKYYITDDISQGDIMYLKGSEYLAENSGEKTRHHERQRIVMQGITGVNEKWRLKMTMSYPPYYCANSVNYLMPPRDKDFDYYILGILNSKLLNWYFSKLSTNSNVNGYEIDALPIIIGNDDQVSEIISLVKEELQYQTEDRRELIDDIVYSIYGITEYDIPLIEG